MDMGRCVPPCPTLRYPLVLFTGDSHRRINAGIQQFNPRYNTSHRLRPGSRPRAAVLEHREGRGWRDGDDGASTRSTSNSYMDHATESKVIEAWNILLSSCNYDRCFATAATKGARRITAQAVSDALGAAGDETDDERPANGRAVSVPADELRDDHGVAERDLDDIRRSDALILVHSANRRGGMWVEFGYALASPALRTIFWRDEDCDHEAPVFAACADYAAPSIDWVVDALHDIARGG